MAARGSKDVANLKEYIRRLKAYLRKQDAFNRGVRNNLKRLNKKSKVKPPSITDPPKPPFKP